MASAKRLGAVWVAAAAGLAGSGTAYADTPPDAVGSNSSASQVLQETLGVDAVSPNDVWVVGDQTCQSGRGRTLAVTPPPRCTYIQHFDGTIWTQVPAPNPGSVENGLVSVSGHASNDIWAVGYEGDSIHHTQWLIEHWDGSRWNNVAVPRQSGRLSSVAAIAPDDVWVTSLGSTVSHWDGSTWSVEKVHGSPHGGVLSSISASAAGNVFAAGQHRNAIGTHPQTFAAHYDGSRLSVSPTAPSPSDQWFSGVDAIDAGSVWAVGIDGRTTSSAPAPVVPLTEHWNGTTWSRVSAANPPDGGRLAAVSGYSNNDVWAVGATDASQFAPLIEHWNGTTWSIVAGPLLNGPHQLVSVSADAPNDAWAVGNNPYSEAPLVLHWDGTSWTVAALG